uniref:AS2 protein n=1 Tax=Sterkiella nova TaxID=200597 RepID=Q27144_STENO|nr:putative [Sterkiella nova]
MEHTDKDHSIGEQNSRIYRYLTTSQRERQMKRFTATCWSLQK